MSNIEFSREQRELVLGLIRELRDDWLQIKAEREIKRFRGQASPRQRKEEGDNVADIEDVANTFTPYYILEEKYAFHFEEATTFC